MDKKYLIIYHNEDNDGLFSASIFYYYLIHQLHVLKEDIILFGANYNMLSEYSKENSVEDLHNKFSNIIMVDISFNDVKYMKSLWKEFKYNFIWCDHHKPIIDESFKNRFDDIPGIRDTTRSAILCVYKFLYDQFDEKYNDKTIPELLRVLSAWDSWTYEREGYEFDYVKNINKAITILYKLDFQEIYKLTEFIFHEKTLIDLDYYNNYGDVLNRYDDIVMENIIKTSGDCSWKVRFYDEDKGRPLYHSACAIFHQGATNSTMFKSLKRKGINHGLVFKHQPNGNWVLSMYNVSEDEWTHCGEFLKERYNGGGHKGAAGCTLTEDQFINILKDKIL